MALVGPFFYGLTNHIDKFLLDKYFKQSGVGTLILFSSLLSIIPLPILFWFDPTVLDINTKNIFILATVGTLHFLVLWFYLLALKNEEASVAVVFYQLVPVLGYVLGYFVLGEILQPIQLVAMSIIILGTTIIAFEIDIENNFKLRHKTILLMLSSAFLWALGSVIFKFVALEENVWRSLFWEYIMLVLIGIIIFTLMPSYRSHFLKTIRDNSKEILLLNVTNEILYMAGNIIFSFAYLLAPIALVLLAESFQPIFVLAIGVFLTVFFPRVSSEKIEAKHLWQKITAIIITGIGTYLLLSS
jgi:drug/metabolite transporter (DMT)-like permease